MLVIARSVLCDEAIPKRSIWPDNEWLLAYTTGAHLIEKKPCGWSKPATGARYYTSVPTQEVINRSTGSVSSLQEIGERK
jgi:hypothetical protein